MGGQGDAPGAHEGFNGRGQHEAAHPRRGVEHPREEHREPLPSEPDGRGQHQPKGDRPGAEAEEQAQGDKQCGGGPRQGHAEKPRAHQSGAGQQHTAVAPAAGEDPEHRLGRAEHQLHDGDAEAHGGVAGAALLRQGLQKQADVRPKPSPEAVEQAGQQAEKDHPGEGTGFLLTKMLGHGVPSKSPKLSAHLSIISHTHSGVSLQPRASHCRMTAL